MGVGNDYKETIMGILQQAATGTFRGRVGDTVGYLWKGKACLRAYQPVVHYPNTEGQQQQRNWFVGMVRFAAKANEALRLGLRPKAEEHQMTESNYFILKNKQHFRLVNGTLEIDYDQLQIASGHAADVYFKAARFEEHETVVVDFEKNMMSLRASAEDKVYLYIYAVGHNEGFLTNPVARRCKTLKTRLPENWAGDEVHLYGFVVDKEGRPSNSTYIGVGRVNHYEDRGRYIPLNKNWKDFVDIANEANAASTVPPASQAQISEPSKPIIDLFNEPPEIP